MESIKDKVAIVGMGCTQFGERWDTSPEDLVIEAAYEAFADAGVESKDIHAAWVGTFLGVTGSGTVATPLKLDYKPVTRVENACGTGHEALRGACYGLLSKQYDLVLAIGFEKLKDTGFGGLGTALGVDKWHPTWGYGTSAPGRYALAATKYFSKYGLSRDEGKRVLAMISVKSHHNGARNPKAHLRREITIEQVLKAPMIAWPLGLLDCCGVTDGAAAAVMCRSEDAKSFRKDYVTIKGFGLAAGPGMGKVMQGYDFTWWDETEHACRQAYEQAGIKNPRKELDVVELHDCFSIAELIATESLSLCERGNYKKDIEAGTFNQEGEIPINLSGGLKSFGHPIGASGCRETYEIYKQIQGKAQDPSRQLKSCRLGLAHNQGGHPGKFVCAVTIVGEP
ncbi:MAG: acetyl-CoA acetyltransferase [Dehalococcoidia bacterium]|nr:acetyl-CoA acetyltransferase [Dehalococcoidia bacterium]